MKSIEEMTYDELKSRMRWELTTSLFAGKMDDSLTRFIDWSIMWWKAEEERHNTRTKYYIPDGALIADSDLSSRAIRVLTAENFTTAKDIRTFIKNFDHPFQARAAIRKFVNCGRLTTTEIMDYYLAAIEK